jgi:hypothetical protein
MIAVLVGVPVAARGQAAARAKTSAATRTWAAPRTPDGQPELQGTWTNNSATPFQRPQELAGREHLTDVEVERLKKIAGQLFNGDTDAGFGDAVFNLRLTERFTRVAPDTLKYEVTLEDPTTWTKPCSAMIPMKRSTEPIYEYSCHEGNEGLPGALSGERALERQQANKTKGSK